MGFVTDNPARATRLKQLGVQTAIALHEVDKADKALASKRAFVKDLVSAGGDGSVGSAELFLKCEALVLAPTVQDEFQLFVEGQRADVGAVELVTVLVGLFGADAAWNELGVRTHLEWSYPWALLKAAADQDENSILWMTRNPKATKTASLADEKLFVIKETPSDLSQKQLQYLNRLRAQIQLAAGHDFRSINTTILTLASGANVDAFVAWCESKGISPEQHLAACRLAARHTLATLRTLHDLLETLEGIKLIRQVAEGMPAGNPRKRQTMAALAAQRRRLALETAATLSSCTWDKTWYALRDKDVAEAASIEHDIAKDELVQYTQTLINEFENA